MTNIKSLKVRLLITSLLSVKSEACPHKYLILLVLIFIYAYPKSAFTQITSLNYQLKYNTDSCWFDAFFIVNSGNATSVAERTQGFAKFSIIVPTGTNINVIKNYNPIKNNASYTGTTPNDWNIYAAIGAPIADPTSDYYIFAPSFDDESHYNNLNTGDTVKLFSLHVDTIFNCGSGIRIYQNGIDPGQNAPGMGYINFSNTFELVPGSNIYSSNSPTIHPINPLIYNILNTCNTGIEIDISAISAMCQLPLKYQWSGPNNFTSNTQDFVLTPAYIENSGEYKVVVSDTYGCKDSLAIVAENKPNAGNDMVVCANTNIQLSGSDPFNGTWSSSAGNSPGATLTNFSSGLANVLFSQTASGLYKFIYSSGSCSDTMEITVFALPSVNIIGSDSICKGQTTQLSPISGGSWISSNPTIATISQNGLVTSLSSGNVNFTFTEFLSGCPSETDSVTVNPIPSVAITGTPDVCVGSTTNLIPNSNGSWMSNNLNIAAVDNTGIVTGINNGQTYVLFTDNITGCTSEHLNIIVKAIPEVEISGPNSICLNAITQLTPSSQGSWESLQPSIASVSSNGVVTGLSPGNATFRWTETSTGCKSALTGSVTVVASPVLTMGSDNICSGNFMIMSANTTGSWTSSNPAIATILPGSGLVTGISPGNVTFTFVRSSDFCVTKSDTLIVNPSPVISAATSELCIGSAAILNPASGGTWTSLDESILAIFGNTAVGVNAGFVTVRYTESNTGCENTILFNVSTRPQVSITDSDKICIGSTTQLSPSSGGVWSSSNTSVATVNDLGVVTGVSNGAVTFIFTENASGCNSQPTNPVTIKPLPVIFIPGQDTICIGTTTIPFSSGTGMWTGSNSNIANVNSSTGLTTGTGPGSITLRYTESSSGCTSLPSQPITILGPPDVSISGQSILCTGATTQLVPNAGGIWSSNNPSTALVNNTGLVTSISSGIATFTFTQTSQICNYEGTTGTLTVTSCFNPDFNVTHSNVLVLGNLSTNDQDPSSNIYNNTFTLISGPVGGTPIVNINPDGSYSFEADVEGIYTLEIPVCVFPSVINCPKSTLTVTVKNDNLPVKLITANVDIVSTAFNTPVVVKTLNNDACISVISCNPDPGSVSIISNIISGMASVNPVNGDITYTPSSGFSGIVFLTYKVCAQGEPNNCDTASQIITVLSPTSENSLTVCDDLSIGKKGLTLSGNVLLNDSDPEGNTLSVLPQNITGTYGSFQLNSNGSFSFVPSNNFIGPVRFVYDVCDNNSMPVCKKATLYVLVLSELSVNIRVYLEGALMNNANATSGGRPLMRDNLRMSPFTGTRYIPDSDPYKIPTLFVNMDTKYIHKNPGNKPEFETIPNPTSVFSVTGRDAIVDWVFVELRSKSNKTLVTATRSGLLQRDGDVVDIDGISTLRFPDTAIDSYYVVVRHRNHLGAMTANPQSPEQLNDVINFTSPSTLMFDFGTSKNNGYDYTGMAQKGTVKNGYMALWAGDFDANRRVKSENPNDDLNYLLFDVLFYPNNIAGNANFDFAVGYFQSDFDLNSKAKFDNPNDDKNMLFAQLLFYPPNLFFLSNYDFFIEQVP